MSGLDLVEPFCHEPIVSAFDDILDILGCVAANKSCVGQRSILESGLPSLFVSSIWTCKFAYLVLSRISCETDSERVGERGVSSMIDTSASERIGVAAMVGASFTFFCCSAVDFRLISNARITFLRKFC